MKQKSKAKTKEDEILKIFIKNGSGLYIYTQRKTSTILDYNFIKVFFQKLKALILH